MKRQTIQTTGAPRDEYITASSDFRIWAEQQLTNAERLIEDLDQEIVRLEAEVDARKIRRADLAEIVARATAALTIDLSANRPSPVLTDRKDTE